VATQTVEFRSPPSQTITAKLFAVGSDTQVASVSATEATNRKGTYSAAYTDVPAGEYELIALVGAVPVARWFVTLTLTTATFQARDKVGAVELDSASRLAIWNTLTTETFTADSFGELLLISDGTNGRAVKVTGANHIAADVHDCQADGLSGSTEIAAINTFATRVTTGLVQDGAVYQFTANMLELAPSGGGGSSVNVLPATGIVADRSAGATLVPVVGETISQSITLYRTDGTTAISLSGKTLVIVFETLSGVDVATVASGSITISGASSNIVTFAYPSAVTASERTLRFAIRDAAAPSTLYMQGVCSVVRAPQVDA